jgi:hypothetical protein
MAKNQDEINQRPSGEAKRPGLRVDGPNKRAGVVKTNSTEQNLGTADGRGRAFWQANRQVKETLSWPLGY